MKKNVLIILVSCILLCSCVEENKTANNTNIQENSNIQENANTQMDVSNESSPVKTDKKEKKKSKKQIKKDFIKSCKTRPYKKILRNPEKYTGEKIKIKIKITDLHDGLIFKYYIGEDKNGKQYTINEERDSEKPKFYDGDTVMVYGTVCGVSTIEGYKETGSKVLNFLQEKEEKYVVEVDMKYAKLIKG